MVIYPGAPELNKWKDMMCKGSKVIEGNVINANLHGVSLFAD